MLGPQARLALFAAVALASPVVAAQIPVARSQWLAQLGSASLPQRVAALRHIEASPGLLKSLAAGRVMAAVLSADTNPLDRSSRVWHEGYSERWAAFDSALTAVLARSYGFSDPRIRRALVFAPYDPQSGFARRVASQGSEVLGDILQLWSGGTEPVRARAVGVFGFLLELARAGLLKHPLSARQSAMVRDDLRAALRSPKYAVRYAAVGALGRAGGTSDLPLLRRVAATDPSCAAAPRAINVCVQAWRAIWEIQRREGGQRAPRAIAPAQLAAARRSLQGATRSPSAAARRAAVAALGRGGSSADVTLLYALIGEDPDCTAHPRELNVCILARRSIAEIRRRAAAARRGRRDER